MSWYESNSRIKKCPCQSGTYTIRTFDDDWGRSDETWEMNCKKCKNTYQLYEDSFQEKDKSWTDYIWVSKKEYEKLKALEGDIQKLSNEIINYAKSHYMNNWISYFKDAKSRKEVWRRLDDCFEGYPTLTTFYSHTKNRELNEYLKDELNYENIPFIINQLNIRDDKLNRKLVEINTLENKLEISKEEIIKNGFS